MKLCSQKQANALSCLTMLVLGIESTCDETACSVVRDGKEILSNVISSQIDLHREFGGVVPELACRRHVDVLIPVIDQALKVAGVSLEEIDLIAVAMGPGLIGALLIGLNGAKALSVALGKPFVGVNHIEAHLYAAMMPHLSDLRFPCLGVVISGGHTSLVQINAVGNYKLIGQTVDDAIGEAFDKVAALLDLPYPGGPAIEALARTGDPKRYPFKPGRIKGRPLDFSFSGLKTNVLYLVKGHGGNKRAASVLSASDKKDVAASFQDAALRDIVEKTALAIEAGLAAVPFQAIVLGGGVSNNQQIRKMFQEALPQQKILWPPSGLSLDNAAMIAGLGFHQYQPTKQGDSLDLCPMTRIPFGS